jgi:hypothetical protein
VADDDKDTTDGADNVISLEQFKAARDSDGSVDDDDLLRYANKKIAEWKAAGMPSFAVVQKLFHDSICAGASAMARDKIIAAVISTFNSELGGKSGQ